METWVEIPDFPRYSVSDHGNVRNDHTGRILKAVQNQYDVLMVGLMKDGTQFKRSVPLLVARAFIEPEKPHFDTPVNLNGHRMDNHVRNLVWRPRWYAVAYNQQFKEPYEHAIDYPIRDTELGMVFPNSFAVATAYGLLEKDIVLSILNNTIVWLTFQKFEMVE
ncbi:MAG TPA: NUMOD4 domain-containing protein [Nitrospira sp.]|nr:NUMOD4 domain-containing protein [Nitrospira sp.]